MYRGSLIAVFVMVLTTLGQAQQASVDWTQWRGPARDGVASTFAAPREWPEQLVQKWKVDVGLGYATPLIVGNRIYMFSRQGENEVMSALDAANGTVLWKTEYPASFTMQRAAAAHGPGPKSTPVFNNGKLYTIGMTGIVTALDAATGKQLWQKAAPGIMTQYTTHSFSPIVENGMVIFHVGGHEKGALTAFDPNTGDVKWSWEGDGPAYGSPVVANLGGTRQVVTLTQVKVVGVDAATGALLWERPLASPSVSNAVTPIIYGQTVIMAGSGPLTAFTPVKNGNQWTTEVAWENPDLTLRFATGVLAGDVLFGLSGRNGGQYFAADAKTGKTLWTSEGRQAQHASIARVGENFVVMQGNGELLIVKNSPTAFETVRRYKVAETDTWTQAAYSGNRILVKDVSTLALYTLN